MKEWLYFAAVHTLTKQNQPFKNLWYRKVLMISTGIFTCVMASLHVTIVITNGVEVVDVVVRGGGALFMPSPWRPREARLVVVGVAPLGDVLTHVQAVDGESD